MPTRWDVSSAESTRDFFDTISHPVELAEGCLHNDSRNLEWNNQTHRPEADIPGAVRDCVSDLPQNRRVRGFTCKIHSRAQPGRRCLHAWWYLGERGCESDL